MKTAAAVLLAATFLQGCSHLGPFVTHIAPDGRGGLTVDTCGVYVNGFTGIPSMEKCSSANIQVLPATR
jgi:hypothetical protein